MNTVWRSAIRIIVFLAVAVLPACILPTRTLPGFTIRMVDPENGAIFTLGRSQTLWAEAESTAGSVTDMYFYANGRLIGEATLERFNETIYTGLFDWSPEETGEFFLQIQAKRSDRTVFSEAIRVCVIEFDIAPNAAGFLNFPRGFGYEGPCTIEEPGLLDATSKFLEMTIFSTPHILDFVPRDVFCPGARSRVVEFQALLTDPADQISFVTVEVFTNPVLVPSTTITRLLILNHTGDEPSGREIYTGEMDLGGTLASYFQDPAGGAISGDLPWSARALSHSGEILIEQSTSITGMPVDCAGTTILLPTETPTPSVTPTATTTPTPTRTLIPPSPTRRPKDDPAPTVFCPNCP